MKIYQLNPTLVLGTKGQVLKIFETASSCLAETAILNRSTSPNLSALDTGEQIRIVKTIWQRDNILALEVAKGSVLSAWSGVQETFISLVAHLLARRHSKILGIEGRYEGQLLGDFVVDHLFWDEETKIMTFIDPGANYFVEGNLGEDCARFMFSICSTFLWNPIRAAKLVTLFARIYVSEIGDEKVRLTDAVKFRFVRSVEKFKKQKSFMRALLGVLLVRIHYYLIYFTLRRFDA